MRRIAALLLVVLGASACDAQLSATEVVTKSPAALTEKRTSKIAMEMEFSGNPSGQAFSFQMKGEGEQDYVARKARMTFSFVGQGLPGPQETIIDRDVMYSRVPCSSGPLIGKTWVSIDQRTVTGIDPGSATSNDPASFLEGLRGAENVEKVGVEEVRGVSTTHYKVRIDPKKALENLTPERREEVEGLFGSFGTGIFADVWIDDEGLPRRYSSSIESGAGSPNAFKVKTTIEPYDYGAPVDIPIPPQDQVYAATDLQALAKVCAPPAPSPR